MLHSAPTSSYKNPFDFASSSPERVVSSSYVATRANPYSAKIQNTQYYTTLGSAAQLVPIDPRLCTPTVPTQALSVQIGAADFLYSALEASNRSPRCSSKPQPSSLSKLSPPTMVKTKPRSIKALALDAEMAAAKRSNQSKAEIAAATKRRKGAEETKRLYSKWVSRSKCDSPPQTARQAVPDPIAASSQTRTVQSEKAATTLPRITIRSPTPEPELSVQQAFNNKVNYQAMRADHSTPIYERVLLRDLQADMAKAGNSLDDVLSKYLDPHKYPVMIYRELLSSLAMHLSRLYCCVKQPESDLGMARIRAIATYFFQHVVTGFIHLLEDQRAHHRTPSYLALASLKLSIDMDNAIEGCCRIANGPSRTRWNLDHGDLFVKVLSAELDEVLGRGLAITGSDSSLALPPDDKPSAKDTDSKDLEAASPRPGSIEWMKKVKERREWAQEGRETDMFTDISVATFVGELMLHNIIEARVITKWLDRFLVQTVYVGVPSNWEIECACALLATAGAALERGNDGEDKLDSEATSREAALTSNLDSKDRTMQDATSVICAHADASVLDKAMARVQQLLAQGEISTLARDWLAELQHLRLRGWKQRTADSDSDAATSSDSL